MLHGIANHVLEIISQVSGQMPTLGEALAIAEAADVMEASPKAEGFDVNALLGAVDQFLSPLVRKELEVALRPVVEAANKPPLEVEKIVTVRRCGSTAPGRVIAAKAPTPVKHRQDRELQQAVRHPTSTPPSASARSASGTATATPPSIDPFYVVDRSPWG